MVYVVVTYFRIGLNALRYDFKTQPLVDRWFRLVLAGFYCSKQWQPPRTGRNRRLSFEVAPNNPHTPCGTHWTLSQEMCIPSVIGLWNMLYRGRVNLKYSCSTCQFIWKSHTPYGRLVVNLLQGVWGFKMEQPFFISFTYQTDLYLPRKFKGGIGCDGHLAVTYVGRVIVPSDFFFANISSPSNFVQCVLPFWHGLKPSMHLGYHALKIIDADHAEWMITPNPEVHSQILITSGTRQPVYWRLLH